MEPRRPNLFVVSMHKAASTFVADILLPSIAVRTAWYELYNIGSELIEFSRREVQGDSATADISNPADYEATFRRMLSAKPIPDGNTVLGRLYPNHLNVLREHLSGAFPQEWNRLLVVRRDPRDALISLFWSIARSHPVNGLEDGNVQNFLERRRELQSVSACEGIKQMLNDQSARLVFDEFMAVTDLLREHPEACDLSYELLMERPRQWLTRFVTFGGLADIVDHNWQTEMLLHLRPPGSENPDRHKRRMRPGNWSAVFDDELMAAVDERIGDRMREFGYGPETGKEPLRRAA